MSGALLALFTAVGGVVTTGAAVAVVYYLATRRPTPDMRLRDAVRELRWSYAFAFFIAPCTLAGAMDGDPLFGFVVGMLVPVFMVGLTWWSGPL